MCVCVCVSAGSCAYVCVRVSAGKTVCHKAQECSSPAATFKVIFIGGNRSRGRREGGNRDDK